MENLINDYEAILAGDADASDKFWKLEKRMRKDKKKSGVCVTDMSRSQMFANIMALFLGNEADGFAFVFWQENADIFSNY